METKTTIDKSKELHTTLHLINEKLNFEGIVDGNRPISLDYIPPYGDNLGYTSLELFLLSLSSCVGHLLLILLRKQNKDIQRFEIKAQGFRNQDHPTSFKSIVLNINIYSGNTSESEVQKLIKLAEETYCPVWAMIKGNVSVEVKINIFTLNDSSI